MADETQAPLGAQISHMLKARGVDVIFGIPGVHNVEMYRGNVNFIYWRTRCEGEQMSDTVSARRHIYQAKQLQDDGELESASKEYDQAWKLWAGVIEENPGLMQVLMAEDLYEDVERYVDMLGHLERRIPADFGSKPS